LLSYFANHQGRATRHGAPVVYGLLLMIGSRAGLPVRVLFLCTHNSARSQMAEGILRALAGDRFDVASAGTEATRVHPLAIRAMAEVGIDLTGHTSKTIDGFLGERWDYVITVCDHANEQCPVFPGETTRIHWSFEDPSQATGTDEDRLGTFRRVRDEIQRRLCQWLVDQEQSPPFADPTAKAS